MARVNLTTTVPSGITTTYAVTSGSLPTGMTLDANTGVISGTPSTVGYNVSGVSSTFNITATNNLGNANVRSFIITRRWTDGSNSIYAAPHAKYIKDLGIGTNAFYWIKPQGYSEARQVWCDQTNNGGGWMLMTFCGINITFGAHVEDNIYEVPFNMDSASTSTTSTLPTAGRAGNMGNDFIDQLVTNGRSRGISLFRIQDSGGTYQNYFILCDSNARWLPVGRRRGDITEMHSDPGNQWLKTARLTYTADAGNNGAGTLSGTTHSWGGSNWGTFPYNMDPGSQNWGFSISPTYASGGFGYPTWNSCHSNGWNRPGSFWIKVA